MLFTNVGSANGSISINLAAVSMIRWGLTAKGGMQALVWFDTDDPVTLEGESAEDLSQAVSALEADAERRLSRFYGVDDSDFDDEPAVLPFARGGRPVA